MTKRKRTTLCITAATALFLIIDQTMAYFRSEDYITNRLSAKVIPPKPETYVRIDVCEDFAPPSSKSNEPFRKDVKIGNSGTEDCYVRVRLEFSDSEYRDITDFSHDGTVYTDVSAYSGNYLPEGWVYNDGFYYYTSSVASGSMTGTSLISWVNVDFSSAPLDLSDEFDIYVYAEAVQAVDENGEEVGYQDAWGI